MPSGKSKSIKYPNGVRRIDKKGNKLAPRSLWRKGKRFLKSCPDKQLKKLNLNRED